MSITLVTDGAHGGTETSENSTSALRWRCKILVCTHESWVLNDAILTIQLSQKAKFDQSQTVTGGTMIFNEIHHEHANTQQRLTGWLFGDLCVLWIESLRKFHHWDHFRSLRSCPSALLLLEDNHQDSRFLSPERSMALASCIFQQI